MREEKEEEGREKPKGKEGGGGEEGGLHSKDVLKRARNLSPRRGVKDRRRG